MRPSKLRHPVAVLRQIIEYLQPEFANLVRKKTITIQKIENGGLKLSEDLGSRISHETGVRLDWLLAGDPAKPPVTASGAPYTKEFFDQHRARKTPSNRILDELMLPTFAIVCHARIRSSVESAHRKGADFQLARFKIERFLADMAEKFGEDPDISKTDERHVVRVDLLHSTANEKALLKKARDVVALAAKPPRPSKRSSGRAKRPA